MNTISFKNARLTLFAGELLLSLLTISGIGDIHWLHSIQDWINIMQPTLAIVEILLDVNSRKPKVIR